MAIVSTYVRSIAKGTPLFRVTSPHFFTSNAKTHKNVVNGEGPIVSGKDGRFHHPGVKTVYLTVRPETALAETSFYFVRAALNSVQDGLRQVMPFSSNYVMWEITFKKDLIGFFDLRNPGARANCDMFEAMLRNPSTDYRHLKERRAQIESQGYSGLIAPSARCTADGDVIVSFKDLSKIVDTIVPHQVSLRMLCNNGTDAFVDHRSQCPIYTATQIVYISGPVSCPACLTTFSSWSALNFRT